MFAGYLFLPFIQNMGDTCWSRHLDRHIPDQFPTCCQSKATCATGKLHESACPRISLKAHIRRSLARKHLKPNEVPITFTSFPRLGVAGQFTEPYFDPSDAISSHSLFLPEEITNPHARFPWVPIPKLKFDMH